MNLESTLQKASAQFGDHTALSGRGVEDKITYRELGDRVERLAGGFLEIGIGRGDRVAILMNNHSAFVEASFAIYRLGAVKVPLNSMLTEKEHDQLLDDAGVDVIITESDFISHCFNMKHQIRDYIIVGEFDSKEKSDQITSYNELLKSEKNSETVNVSLDDVCALMYTSGTTGQPKGVQHTHGTWLLTAIGLKNELCQKVGEVTLHAAPLSHGSGFLVESTIISGGTNHILGGFNTDEFYKSVDKNSVNTVFLAPTMIYKLLDNYEDSQADVSSLENVYYAGSPMSAARVAEGIDLLGDVFIQSYGQMECPMLITVLDQDDHTTAIEENNDRLESAGREVDLACVRVVDENGKEVPQGDLGEITVKAPHIMLGYRNLPEITNNTIKDGWLYTGDIGKIDSQRYLYILDRKKDMIITGGMNVFPREIEEVMLNHPDISNVAVIGLPDDYWGEKVTAFVEPRNTTTKGPTKICDELEEICKRLLAGYKKPKDIIVVENLPKSSYGKVLKRELRDEFWEDTNKKVN